MVEAGLLDAIDPGRLTTPEDGFTWGYQINKRSDYVYPKSRLDKFLYTPDRSFYVTHPDIIGKGSKDRGGRFVSDHYGLAADVVIQE